MAINVLTIYKFCSSYALFIYLVSRPHTNTYQKYSHVCLEPLTHHRSAGRALHIKASSNWDSNQCGEGLNDSDPNFYATDAPFHSSVPVPSFIEATFSSKYLVYDL